MTEYGQATLDYARLVTPRPFSRFTSNPKEIQANKDWSKKVEKWLELTKKGV